MGAALISFERHCAIVLLVGLGGCTSAGKPAVAAQLEAIFPGVVYVDEVTPIVLTGRAFTPKATARWGATADEVSANATFEVLVGTQPLQAVTWVDANTLSAIVPLGLALGKHTVRVTDPYGVSTSLTDALEIQVRKGPEVAGTLVAARKTVSRGQVIELVAEASNVGQTAVKQLLVSCVPVPMALVGLKTSPLARDVASGAKQQFSFFFDTLGRGDVAFRADGLGSDALTAAPVAMAPAMETVTIVNPAALTISTSVSATGLTVGQRLTLTATVTNPGEAKALAVTPTVALNGPGRLTAVSAPISAVVSATPVLFVWEYDAASTGAVQLMVTATGTDENSLAVLTAVASVGVTIAASTNAVLSTTYATPARVNAGQPFSWSLTVANAGGSTAMSVSPGPITVISASMGVADGGPSPASGNIAAGSAQTFAFGYVAGGPGPLSFRASPAGIDAVTSMSVVAPQTTSATIQVERAAQLGGVLTIPPIIEASTQFNASLQVRNTGDAVALGVTPAALAIVGSASLVSGPTPAAADLGGDGGTTFTWVLAAGVPGTVQVTGGAAGVDSNSGNSVGTGPKSSNTATISEVFLLSDDPFGDVTPFSFIFSYSGRIWLAPNKNGSGAVSMNADGSGPASHAFSFAKDTSGTRTHSNTAAGPYPSLGRTGCSLNTPSCGPDNENGRGLFFAGTFLGSEWLGAAGARTGGLFDYFYLSTDTDPTIDFRFVDTDAIVGNNLTHTVSAAHFFNNRLYLGLPDSTGTRPYLLALIVAPPATGLNAVIGTRPDAGIHVLDLEAEYFPGMGSAVGNAAPSQMIDAITDFNDRVYAANNGGIIRSTTNLPSGIRAAAGDWSISTPSAAGYTSRTSVTTMKSSDLLPADRAFPSMVSYRGKLYAARNTTVGPQLWACTPGADLECAPSEWALIANNSLGDTSLSQFNAAGNTSIGLLAATASSLFVGFNNAGGVVIYKTTAVAPAARSDFRGASGCVASGPACQGLGNNGLGAPASNRQIFDSRVLTFAGSSWLYLVTGNGTSAVQVWRI